jgi:hypothetical protein
VKKKKQIRNLESNAFVYIFLFSLRTWFDSCYIRMSVKMKGALQVAYICEPCREGTRWESNNHLPFHYMRMEKGKQWLLLRRTRRQILLFQLA